jgi:Helix-turn-helix domain
VYRKVTAPRNYLDSCIDMDIIMLTAMKRSRASKLSRAVDAKAEALRRQGALHPHPDSVRDEAFRQGEFFDSRDLVQVRYEMLRRRQVDGQAVTEAAVAFGVSRQAFYTAEAAFEERGISGLLPRRRGPNSPWQKHWKLTGGDRTYREAAMVPCASRRRASEPRFAK